MGSVSEIIKEGSVALIHLKSPLAPQKARRMLEEGPTQDMIERYRYNKERRLRAEATRKAGLFGGSYTEEEAKGLSYREIDTELRKDLQALNSVPDETIAQKLWIQACQTLIDLNLPLRRKGKLENPQEEQPQAPGKTIVFLSNGELFGIGNLGIADNTPIPILPQK